MTFEVLIYSAPAVLIALVLHELSHGLVSYKLGDPTPKATGRLSLNPLRHLDLFGTLSLLIVGFGWAKPVMINPNYYKNKKLGTVLTALAGPAMNIVLAFIGCFAISLITRISGGSIAFQTEAGYQVFTYIWNFLYYFVLINIGLGCFNLIPFPPLDGSKVLLAILPERIYFQIMRYERYGQLVLFLLLFLGVLDTPLLAMRNFVYTCLMTATNFLCGL